jgi:putative aldouronate transport system substrate-binding protein
METIISAKTEYPAVADRFVDWASSEEGHLYRYYGFEGINYRAAKPGELNIAGEQAVWTEIENVPAEYENWGLGHFITPYGGTRRFFDTLFSVQKDPKNLSTHGKTEKEMLYHTTFVETYPYNDPLEDIWPGNMVFPAVVRTELGVLKTNVNGLIEESAAKFVIGELDLDRDWDRFQANLKSAGLDRYLQICQEALDARNK